MPHVARSIEIRRPVDEVWNVITDFEALSKAGGGDYRLTSPGPLGVGSTIEEIEDHKGPPPLARVIDLQTNRSYTFTITGELGNRLANVKGGYVLDRTPNGTQLTQWYDFDFVGALKIVGTIVSLRWAQLLRKPLARIKTAMEKDSQN